LNAKIIISKNFTKKLNSPAFSKGDIYAVLDLSEIIASFSFQRLISYICFQILAGVRVRKQFLKENPSALLVPLK